MRYILAAMMLLVCSCNYYPKPVVGTYTITYHVVETYEDALEQCHLICNGEPKCEQKMQRALACARWKGRKCTIIMPIDQWERSTVHEVGHCLNVNYHN